MKPKLIKQLSYFRELTRITHHAYCYLAAPLNMGPS